MVHIYASHPTMFLLAYLGSGSLLDGHLLFTTMSTRPRDSCGLLVSHSLLESFARRLVCSNELRLAHVNRYTLDIIVILRAVCEWD